MIYLALKSAVYLINTKPPTLPLKYHELSRLDISLLVFVVWMWNHLMTFIYAKHFVRGSSAVTFNTMSLVVLLDSREIPIRQHGQLAGAPLLILSEICWSRLQMNASVTTKTARHRR